MNAQRVSMVFVAVIAALAGTSAHACSLPIDPYVVTIPDYYTLPTGEEVNIDQYAGFINAPGLAEGHTRIGYIEVPADTTINWTIYWDPSKGQGTGNIPQSLKNLVTDIALKKNFKLMDSPEVITDLFDLGLAQSFIGVAGNPMNVNQIYDDDPSAGGNWNTAKRWASAPYDIGGRVRGMTRMKIRVEGGPSAITGPGPLTGQDLTSPPSQSEWAGAMNWLETKSPKGAGRRDRPGYDEFVDVTYDGIVDQQILQDDAVPAGQTGTKTWWSITAGEWKGTGGRWRLASLGEVNAIPPDTGLVASNPSGSWDFDVMGTGYNTDQEKKNGIEEPFTFRTPSAPLFYLVQPRGTFYFALEGGGSYWEWVETKYQLNYADGVTTELESVTLKAFIELAIIAKAGKGDAAKPTLVRVVDQKAPRSAILSPTTVTARTGESAADGGVSLTGGQVYVLDNNPYDAVDDNVRSNILSLAPGVIGNYEPGQLGAQLVYSVQMDEYSGQFTGPEGFGLPLHMLANMKQSQKDAIKFPLAQNRFKWVRGDTLTRAGIQAYAADGSPVTNLTANGITGQGDPAFVIHQYQLEADDFNATMGVHHASSPPSGGIPTATDSWSDSSRLKFFVEATDGTGQKNSTMMGSLNIEDLDQAQSSTAAEVSSARDAAGTAGGGAPFGFVHGPAGEIPSPGYNQATYSDPVDRFAFATTVLNNSFGLGINQSDWKFSGGPFNGETKAANYGIIDTVTDTFPPNIAVFVTDTKYDQTYTFYFPYQGALMRGYGFGGPLAGPIPNETLDEMLSRLPNSGRNEGLQEELRNGQTFFDMVDENAGTDNSAAYQAFHAKVNGDGFSPIKEDGGTIYRLSPWVDEDTNLLFKVVVWDNINYTQYNPRGPMRNGGPVPENSIAWYFVDEPSDIGEAQTRARGDDSRDMSTNVEKPWVMDSDGQFEYTFRNPNESLAGPLNGGMDCYLQVEAADIAGRSSTMRIYFNVLGGEDVTVTTLEERREALE